MNILVTNDDGPDAYGLQVLRDAIREFYRGAAVVTLTPDHSMGGQALSVSCVNHEQVEMVTRDTSVFTCAVRPADLIYIALGHPERFLPTGTFDLVVTGVNHGANVGMDVLHSGTVGMAMLAATYFGVGAIAFSQQLEDSTDGRRGKRGEVPISANAETTRSEAVPCPVVESLSTEDVYVTDGAKDSG